MIRSGSPRPLVGAAASKDRANHPSASFQESFPAGMCPSEARIFPAGAPAARRAGEHWSCKRVVAARLQLTGGCGGVVRAASGPAFWGRCACPSVTQFCWRRQWLGSGNDDLPRAGRRHAAPSATRTASAAARSASSRSSDTRSSSKSFQRPHNDQRLSHLSGYFLSS